MLRILFLILAVISAALAVILNMPWLFVVAGALALTLLVVWLMHMRRRGKSASPETSAATNLSREQELAALGISEVRARGAGESSGRQPPPEGDRPPQSHAGTATDRV